MAMSLTRSRHAAGGRSANAESGRPHSAAGIAILVAVVGAVVATLAVGFTMAASESAARRTAVERAAGTAALLTQAAEVRFASARNALTAFAQRPELAEALVANDRDRLSQLAGIFRAAFPRALRLLVVPNAGLQPAPDANPPIGYALVEQIDAALNSAGASTELHFAGGPKAHINMVAPIASNSSVDGALVLSYPQDALSELLQPPGGGNIVLTQSLAGQSSRVLELGSTGDANHAGSGLEIGGTPWRIHYASPPPAGIWASPALPTVAAVIAVALLVVSLVGFWAARMLETRLAQSGNAFVELLRAAKRGHFGQRPKTTLSELEPAMAAGIATAQEEPDDESPAPAAPAPTSEAREPAEHTATSLDAPPSGDQLTTEEMPMAAIDPSILRAYDIRGVVGATLTPEVMATLGRAIGSEAAARGEPRIVVGFDGRHSSPELAEALIGGLVAAGRDVIDVGRVTTPMVYFAAHHLETGCGVAVTGSHNPPEYNGLKIVIGGDTLWGDGIQALGQRVAEDDLVTGSGSVEQRAITDDYLERIASDVTLHRPLHVVVDAGNGIAGETAPRLYERLGCRVEPLYCEVDGDFPNHHPDPTVPENLAALIDRVTQQGADLGVAFDGDGDRLGVVDNHGQILWPDRQMMLYAADILAAQPGADIIFDVKCTSHLARVISDNAGVPVMWKTGHSLIKEKLKETGAPLAGEMSGHLFFNDRWYGFDDGIYAGARLLELLSVEARTAEAIFAELPAGVSTPELRLDLQEGEPPQVMQALLAETEGLEDARVTTIDGLRVDFPDGWGLVRASNTQPCLVLRFEGSDDAALERIRELFRERLERARPGLALPF